MERPDTIAGLQKWYEGDNYCVSLSRDGVKAILDYITRLENDNAIVRRAYTQLVRRAKIVR